MRPTNFRDWGIRINANDPKSYKNSVASEENPSVKGTNRILLEIINNQSFMTRRFPAFISAKIKILCPGLLEFMVYDEF